MLMNGLSWAEAAEFALGVAASGVPSGLLAGVFGIGGGAVLVPVFYHVFGLLNVSEVVRMHVSVGSSIAIILPTAIQSYAGHRARGAVDTNLLRFFLVPVPIGVALASLAVAHISNAGLRVIFAVLILFVGLRMTFNREHWRLGAVLPGATARWVMGLVIGFFSTLMGIGGGMLNNAFMTLFSRPMHQAVAASSGVGVLIAAPGTIGYVWAGWGHPLLPPFSTGFVNWIAVTLVIPIALVVTPYGVALAHRLGRRQLEFGFGLFCLLVSARFFVSLLPG